MSEITRQEVIGFMEQVLNGMKTNFPESNAVQAYKKAIEYIRQVPIYRKKAKRWKRKYMDLKSKMVKIRKEITDDYARTGFEMKKTQSDIDCGINIGLKMALDTIFKHIDGITPFALADKESEE